MYSFGRRLLSIYCTLGTGLAPGDTYMTMTDQLLVGEKGKKQANK